MIVQETRSAAIGTGKIAAADVRRLEFKYDYASRRVEKVVKSGWNGSAYTATVTRRFLYNGWNVIAEFDVNSLGTISLVRSFAWGLDLSGSLDASGGIGALVRIHDHGTGLDFVPTYDGNGNVLSLVRADTGAVVVAYEYGPFGEPLRAEVDASYSGDSTVRDNPFRFSTKFMDVESGLVYYGYRYYLATLGRFINRDPSEEQGGLNLYGFCGNDGVNRWDVLGLDGDVEMMGAVQAENPWANWTFADYAALGQASRNLDNIKFQFWNSRPAQQPYRPIIYRSPIKKDNKAPNKTEKPKIENDCTQAYDAIVYNTPALPTGGRLDRALQSSGLDVETQLSQAWKESSFNPSAVARPPSHAVGLFQFQPNTKRDVETRVWNNMVSSTTPFLTPGVTGDWRLDPGVSAQANYVYMLDRIAAAGGSLAGGLGRYYGGSSATARQDYANDVLSGRSVLQDFADKHGGNLREALEQDCAKIKAALSK